MKKILLYIAPILLLASCNEQTIETFESEASLYFYQGTSNSKGAAQSREATYSFFLFGSRQSDNVWLDVLLTGAPASHDRPISIRQTNADAEGAAVAGRDFEAFDSPTMVEVLVMPAGATSVAIPLMLRRTTAMESEEFVLELEITPNADFTAGIEERQTFSLTITAMAARPATWAASDDTSPTGINNGYRRVFGNWGQEKMRFLIDNVGYGDFEDPLTNIDLQRFWNLKAREALENYYAAGAPTLFETDGITEVTFPQV